MENKKNEQYIRDLIESEIVLASSYWENHKYHKEIAMSMGNKHPKVLRIAHETEMIRQEWNSVSEELKKYRKDEENVSYS